MYGVSVVCEVCSSSHLCGILSGWDTGLNNANEETVINVDTTDALSFFFVGELTNENLNFAGSGFSLKGFKLVVLSLVDGSEV